MNVMIFDTETTSLNKPFCYNIGYVVLDTDTGYSIIEKNFVVEQIWHNTPLFSSAYYADKRPIYVQEMRAKKTKMDKFGYICREMARDIRAHNIEYAFAFNSDFDERVFNFNCDWFKCINPFDTVAIKDIRAFAHKYLVNDNYKRFCEQYDLFTESGGYSTTAETMYKYITNNINFVEDHTALSDSIIESQILLSCLAEGAHITDNYKAKRTIPRDIEKTLTVVQGEQKFTFKCKGYTVYRKKDTIKLK